MAEREEEAKPPAGAGERPAGVVGERAERLAAALRANLRRRKEQARARGAPPARPAEDR